MLQNDLSEDSLIDTKEILIKKLDADLLKFVVDDEEVTNITFPVTKYPEKVKSLTLDKNPQIEEKLVGIKGQYLLFDNNTVFNVRRHSGYLVQFSY